MELINKKIIKNLKNNHPFIGIYFEIIKFQEKFFLYYCDNKDINTITLIVSENLNFNDRKNIKTNITTCGGCFSIIQEKEVLYMLTGCHNSAKEKNEIPIPDLVWPKEKRTITDWKIERKDRRNGMYLLESNDGINWNQVIDKPVLHAYISSPSCKLGECCFDTHPCLIKHNDEFYYYGRLNSSLDERRIYLRKSKDLIEWSLPEKIIIINENNNKFKKNYYNFVVFKDNNNFYAFTPYFEACGTTKRKTTGGKTLLLKSRDGLEWEIIKDFFPHRERYKDKVNSVLIENDKVFLFFRENCMIKNQSLISYEFIL